jgi:flagellar hook-associated protein 2
LGISFGSIQSGLPKDIVQQIMKAEKIPLVKMNQKKAKTENKKKLLTELETRMTKIRDELIKNKSDRSLRELKSDTNEDLLGVTIDKNIANNGSYDIEVVEMAKKSSAISNGIEDADETYLGVGYIEYTLPNGEDKEIFVDAENSNLNGISKLINKDSENGLRATVVNDGHGGDEPWKLIVSVQDTGVDNKATFPYLYFIDGEADLYLETEREAKNAKVKVDGFEVEVNSNSTDKLIPGVTLDLKQAKPGQTFKLDIKTDTKKVVGKLDELVKAINGVFDFIHSQNKMDENTDTSSTLGGDITLQTIESRLRSAVFSPVMTSKGAKRLSDIGISFQRNGQITMDNSKFETMVSNEFNTVSEILTGRYSLEDGKQKGIFDNLGSMVDSALRAQTGALASRKGGMQSKIAQIDRQIENKERLIEQKEVVMKKKFARLEETISKMKSQGSGLAGMGGGGMNPVQQLG